MTCTRVMKITSQKGAVTIKRLNNAGIDYQSANVIFARRPGYWFLTAEPTHEVRREPIQATGWSRAHSVFGAGVITTPMFSIKMFGASNFNNLIGQYKVTLRYSVHLRLTLKNLPFLSRIERTPAFTSVPSVASIDVGIFLISAIASGLDAESAMESYCSMHLC